MIANAEQFGEIVEATGKGAFGQVEFVSDTKIALRATVLKTADMAGRVSMYFDGRREEVATGRRFEPMSGQWLLRPGTAYRVLTNIEIVKPIPEGAKAIITPTEETRDLLMIPDGILYEGFSGPVTITIIPFRRMDMTEFITVAHMMLQEKSVNIDDEWMDAIVGMVVSRLPKETPKPKAPRTTPKKKTGSAKKKTETPKETPAVEEPKDPPAVEDVVEDTAVEEPNEGSVSDEPTDAQEN